MLLPTPLRIDAYGPFVPISAIPIRTALSLSFAGENCHLQRVSFFATEPLDPTFHGNDQRASICRPSSGVRLDLIRLGATPKPSLRKLEELERRLLVENLDRPSDQIIRGADVVAGNLLAQADPLLKPILISAFAPTFIVLHWLAYSGQISEAAWKQASQAIADRLNWLQAAHLKLDAGDLPHNVDVSDLPE